ncbi:type IV secretion system protein [Pantoea endophytica]|uniref:Type IV secretion system protein n=1 Tax=Pantoea sp. BJ2 TaxID=3141322 RepID=A0AAU7U450_9GAMM
MKSQTIEQTIKAAQNFEQINLDRDQRQKRAGFAVGGAGLLIAVLAIAAVIVMLPLKQTRVDLYVLDKAAGVISKVSEFTEEAISGDLATSKLLSETYLDLREKYNYFSLQDDYNAIQAYNSDSVNKEYIDLFNGPKAPDVIYNKADYLVKTEVISDFITEATDPDKLATIRFKKSIRNVKTGSVNTEFWVARITFRFVDTKSLSEEQRRINKLGYIVTSFDAIQEHGVTQ